VFLCLSIETRSVNSGLGHVCQDLLLSFFSTVYWPPNAVPKMPTASSAQIRKSRSRSAAQITIRYLVCFTFLSVNSHSSPVPSKRAAATTKSKTVQLTSSVSCIDISGISNIIITQSTKMESLLFPIIAFFIFKATLLLNAKAISKCETSLLR
jgi:hypothetical protein